MKLTKTKRKELEPGDMFCVPYKRGVSEVYIVLRDDLIDSLSNAEVIRIEPDDPETAEPESAVTPCRWMCPNRLCRGIIAEETYLHLQRTGRIQGHGGMYTIVLCPICKEHTIGSSWRRVEGQGAGT